MDVAKAVNIALAGFIASGADAAEIDAGIKEFYSRKGSSFGSPPSSAITEDAVLSVAQSFYGHFPGMEPSDNPEKFFGDALTAANGNTETVTAIFDIQQQGRERGEWRDESYPAGLTFWFLKNREHEKLRKQGYAILKGREEATEAPTAMPAAAPVETAAFTPSSNGLDRLNAALGGRKK